MVALSRDGKRAASGYDLRRQDLVKTWNTETKAEVRILEFTITSIKNKLTTFVRFDFSRTT